MRARPWSVCAWLLAAAAVAAMGGRCEIEFDDDDDDFWDIDFDDDDFWEDLFDKPIVGSSVDDAEMTLGLALRQRIPLFSRPDADAT
jgi:hypothetical protein